MGLTAGGQRNAATTAYALIRTDEVEKGYTQICGQVLPKASSRRLVACASHVDEWHFLSTLVAACLRSTLARTYFHIML